MKLIGSPQSGRNRNYVGKRTDNLAFEYPYAQSFRWDAFGASGNTNCGLDPTGRAKETAVNTQEAGPTANRLLAMLPRSDLESLSPAMTTVTLEARLVLSEPGDEPERIYFPHTGMISLLAIMADGKAVETATVGREGVVGAMAGLGLHVPLTRAVVQVPLVASRIAAAPFRRAVQASPAMRDMIVRYNDVLLGQVQITAACNALHPIQKRLARWILQTRDRVDTDTVPLTQELLSEMLGVRRSSVSEIARRLQATGLIHYSRGTIEITDRAGLEAAACECYALIKDQPQRMLS
jgi:CRP-like cAMP-binding protein